MSFMKSKVMCKKFVIWGVVLLFAGAAALGWSIFDQKKGSQLFQSQKEVFEYELGELKDLIDNKAETNYSDAFGKKYRQQLAQYKSRIEFRELIFSVSIVSVVIGTTILTYLPVLWIIRSFPKHLSGLAKLCTDSTGNLGVSTTGKKTGKQLKEVTADNASDNCQNSPIRFKSKEKLSTSNEPYSWNVPSEKEVSVLFSDKESLEPGKSPEAGIKEKPLEQISQKIQETILSEYNEQASKFEDMLRSQAENMDQQAVELKKVTQTVKQTALENSEPINSVLGELTQQISAIREYASNQQGRMEKLQDGYDWNIIKSFCLRIIRCIDNVEKRIEVLSKKDVDMTGYEEIRDELIFALESNGLEQFVPEIKSDYHEQEKYIETVKGKERTDSPELEGKIAKVLRGGYRCIIDDENIKVVRTARVKLFGYAGSLHEVKK